MIISNEITKISSQYKKYKVLFQKESFKEALASHQLWNYEIKLKLKKSFYEKIDLLINTKETKSAEKIYR